MIYQYCVGTRLHKEWIMDRPCIEVFRAEGSIFGLNLRFDFATLVMTSSCLNERSHSRVSLISQYCCKCFLTEENDSESDRLHFLTVQYLSISVKLSPSFSDYPFFYLHVCTKMAGTALSIYCYKKTLIMELSIMEGIDFHICKGNRTYI